MLEIPKNPSAKNHNKVNGPKNLPTKAVPYFCMMNNMVTIVMAIGII